MFESNKIYCLDCMEALEKIPDKYFDFMLTDPPYNISRETNFKTLIGGNKYGMDFGTWDRNLNFTSFIFPYSKKLKENANVVIFSSWQNLNKIKEECENSKIQIKRCLVLTKRNPAPFNRNRMFVNDVEFALWGVYNSKGKPSKWVFNRESKIEKCAIPCNTQNAKYHPTMKDLNVIRKLVRLLSKPGDLILDPFMGSGTTGLAARLENRNFLGFEINSEYCKISNKRILDLTEQTGIFTTK